MNAEQTISGYLIQQLYDHGVRHIFGVPGDYALSLYKELENSPIEVINTCDEQGAGFAADAYARVSGMGAVCVTYCVGGLKVANTTAQAFAEKSPVVVISGSPGIKERIRNPLLHHKVRDFDTQLKVFEQITAAAAVLDDPQTACREIDRLLSTALRYKRPVYIELPRDLVTTSVDPSREVREAYSQSDTHALNEALQEAIGIINEAAKPVILAGVEIQRFGLQDVLLRLLEKCKIPVAATLLSKSVLVEDHPQYIGVYEGAMSRAEVNEYIETSDCLILLGVFMSDINLGIFTSHLDQSKSIYATSEQLSIRYHNYEGVALGEFMQGLLQGNIRQQQERDLPHPPAPQQPAPTSGKPVTVAYLFQRLNSYLDDNTIVIADPGDAMFAALDMSVHCAAEFLSPAYYTSLGFAVPASLGAQLARPERRPLVLVGDGAFQMTGMELSTIARFGLNPIIIVLNNGGYGTERPMLDGSFNDIHLWAYSRIPEVLGAGRGYDVSTEDGLETALQDAHQNTDSFSILDVHLGPKDRSKALERLTEALGKRVKA